MDAYARVVGRGNVYRGSLIAHVRVLANRSLGEMSGRDVRVVVARAFYVVNDRFWRVVEPIVLPSIYATVDLFSMGDYFERMCLAALVIAVSAGANFRYRLVS